MEEKRSLFLECNHFWRYRIWKNQSWSSIFIEVKKSLFRESHFFTNSKASWSSIFIEEKKEPVSWMTLLCQCKNQKYQFWSSIFIKEKKSPLLDWNVFYRCTNQEDEFWSSLSIEEKRACFVNERFFTMQKSEGSILKLYFHWREKSLFFEWHVFWRCTVFLRRIRGASRIACFFIPSWFFPWL